MENNKLYRDQEKIDKIQNRLNQINNENMLLFCCCPSFLMFGKENKDKEMEKYKLEKDLKIELSKPKKEFIN